MKGPGCFIMGPFLIIFALLVGGFLFIIVKIIGKTRASSWKGTVVDKLFNERRNEDHFKEQFYTLVVKTDDGKTLKLAVMKAMYDSCKVGDKMEKPKGALNPHKV